MDYLLGRFLGLLLIAGIIGFGTRDFIRWLKRRRLQDPTELVSEQTFAVRPPPPSPRLSDSKPFLRLDGLASALTALYGGAALACTLLVLAIGNELAELTAFDTMGTPAAADDYLQATNAKSLAAGLYMMAVLLVGILTIVWLWRATSNLERWANPPLRHKPGWAVGSWFIPILNLLIPKLLINDAWRGATMGGTGGRPWKKVRVPLVIHAWWASWVLGTLLIAIGSQGSETDDIGAAKVSLGLSMTGSGILVVAAVLALVAVRMISARQHAAAMDSGLLEPPVHLPLIPHV
jgi:hypothetical protein